MTEDLDIQQSSYQKDKHYWEWSVWLSGPSDVLDKVKHVRYMLHSTFPEPEVVTKDREDNFRLDGAGWGGFLIRALVHFKDGHERKLSKMLILEDKIENLSLEPKVVISYAAGDGVLANRLANYLIQLQLTVIAIDGGFSTLEELDDVEGIVAVIPPRMTPWMERGLKSLSGIDKRMFALIPVTGRDPDKLEQQVRKLANGEKFTILKAGEGSDLVNVARHIVHRLSDA